jgi:hypothetical protein
MIGKHRLPYQDPEIPGQPRESGEISYFTSPTPTGKFTYLGHERPSNGSGTYYTYGDLAAFQDSDGKAYVVVDGPGQGCINILELDADYLHYVRWVATLPGGVEAPYLIKMQGRYWVFCSGVSGWGGTSTRYATAGNIAGPWSAYQPVQNSPAVQNDFLFQVTGSQGSFVLWGGDIWRASAGTRKNMWLPLQWNGNIPVCTRYDKWYVDVAAGTWSLTNNQVSTPVFTPGPGTYASTINVTVSTATSGAQMRYTTDGSTPSATAGTLIGGASGTVTLSVSCTFKAIAFKSGMTDSHVASAAFAVVTGTEKSYSPVADSYVWADTNPGVNYGSTATLSVKDGNVNDKWAYFKFDTTGAGTILSARLRVYGSAEGTPCTVKAYGCDTDSWTETGITWNNKPAPLTTALSTVSTTTTAQYYEWDVTSYIQAQLAGDKMATLVLDSTSLEVKNFNGNSKENATNRPELVAQTTLTKKTIEITSGYTLIALPLVPAAALTAESLARQINADGGHCTSVIEYRDGAFATHPAGTAVENFTLAVGKGYFVRCDRASQVYVTGYPFDRALSPVALSPGYNLIGLPLDPEPADRYTAERVGQEINADDGNATQVITYENGAFQTHPIGTAVNNFTVATGKGYFVRTGKTSTWTVRR